jgi:hypothetical protein
MEAPAQYFGHFLVGKTFFLVGKAFFLTGKIFFLDRKTTYSVRNAFTGFAKAALTV